MTGIEASLYRKVMGARNMVSNKAMLNTMTNIRLGLVPAKSPYRIMLLLS